MPANKFAADLEPEINALTSVPLKAFRKQSNCNYGFVGYHDHREAQAALIALKDAKLNDREIRVEVAATELAADKNSGFHRNNKMDWNRDQHRDQHRDMDRSQEWSQRRERSHDMNSDYDLTERDVYGSGPSGPQSQSVNRQKPNIREYREHPQHHGFHELRNHRNDRGHRNDRSDRNDGRHRNDRHQTHHHSNRDEEEKRRTLFLQNINRSVSDEKIESLFVPFGRLTRFVIIRDVPSRRTDYGFISYETVNAAESALAELDGIVLNGESLRIEKSKTLPGERKKRMLQKRTNRRYPEFQPDERQHDLHWNSNSNPNGLNRRRGHRSKSLDRERIMTSNRDRVADRRNEWDHRRPDTHRPDGYRPDEHRPDEIGSDVRRHDDHQNGHRNGHRMESRTRKRRRSRSPIRSPVRHKKRKRSWSDRGDRDEHSPRPHKRHRRSRRRSGTKSDRETDGDDDERENQREIGREPQEEVLCVNLPEEFNTKNMENLIGFDVNESRYILFAVKETSSSLSKLQSLCRKKRDRQRHETDDKENRNEVNRYDMDQEQGQEQEHESEEEGEHREESQSEHKEKESQNDNAVEHETDFEIRRRSESKSPSPPKSVEASISSIRRNHQESRSRTPSGVLTSPSERRTRSTSASRQRTKSLESSATVNADDDVERSTHIEKSDMADDEELESGQLKEEE